MTNNPTDAKNIFAPIMNKTVKSLTALEIKYFFILILILIKKVFFYQSLETCTNRFCFFFCCCWRGGGPGGGVCVVCVLNITVWSYHLSPRHESSVINNHRRRKNCRNNEGQSTLFSFSLFIYLSVCLSVYLSPSFFMSVCHFVSLPFSLPLSLPFFQGQNPGLVVTTEYL